MILFMQRDLILHMLANSEASDVKGVAGQDDLGRLLSCVGIDGVGKELTS